MCSNVIRNGERTEHPRRLNLTVSLLGFRIVRETQLRVCLWGCFQRDFTGDKTHPDSKGLKLKGKAKSSKHQLVFLSASWLWSPMSSPPALTGTQTVSQVKPSFLQLLSSGTSSHQLGRVTNRDVKLTNMVSPPRPCPGLALPWLALSIPTECIQPSGNMVQALLGAHAFVPSDLSIAF